MIPNTDHEIAHRPICTATKADGQPCTLTSIKGSEFCFSHDPKTVKRSRSNSGRKKTLMNHNDELAVIKVEDPVIQTLQEIIKTLRKKDFTPEVARALTGAVNVLDKALDRRAQLEEVNDRELIIEYVNDWR